MQLSRLFIQSLLEQWSQPPSLAFGRTLQGRQGRRKVFIVKKKKKEKKKRRETSGCSNWRFLGMGKLGAGWQLEGAIFVIGWADIFGFLSLAVSWNWRQNIGKLAFTNQVPMILQRWLLGFLQEPWVRNECSFSETMWLKGHVWFWHKCSSHCLFVYSVSQY